MHNHSHAHHHHHHGVEGIPKSRLLFVILMNFTITVAEVVGGLLSGSLALLSDAIHNLSDTMAMVISYLAILISQKPRNERKTYGYKRAQTLAAFINSAFLFLISFYLIYESIQRFIHPEPIRSGLMITVATIGLLANFVSVLLLHTHSKQSLNLRSSYLHLLGDTISSVGVIAGGVAIHIWKIYWIDPLVTMLIALYILKETWHILKTSTDVLMQTSPQIDLNEMQQAIEELDQVQSFHHVHIWMYDENLHYLEAHIDVEDMMLSETTALKDRIVSILHERFNIDHTTLQFETGTKCGTSIIAEVRCENDHCQ